MSLINDYAAMEQQMKDLQARMERLQSDGRLQQELEFKENLEALMKEYDKSASYVVKLLDPAAYMKGGSVSPRGGRQRRPRRVKVYKNPHTGEVLETRGGNNKTLKQWKEEHSAEEVESWLEEVREP